MKDKNINPKGVGGTALSASKESISLAYLQALLAKNGLNHSVPVIDDNGIDINVEGKDFPGYFPSPTVKIQLKCTALSSAIFSKDKKILKFTLKKFNYNKLVENSAMPLLLVVHVCPDLQSGWVTETKHGVNIRSSSYWFSLVGQDPINRGSKCIHIPLSQRLDSSSLMDMLHKASNGENVVNLIKEADYE